MMIYFINIVSIQLKSFVYPEYIFVLSPSCLCVGFYLLCFILRLKIIKFNWKLIKFSISFFFLLKIHEWLKMQIQNKQWKYLPTNLMSVHLFVMLWYYLTKIVSDSVLFKDAFLKNVFQWRKLLLSAREIPLES